MDIREDLIQHLLKYRKDHSNNQAEMAAYLGIGERTYQTIEVTGEVKKVADLLDIVEKTGFNITQKIANPPPQITGDSIDYLKGKIDVLENVIKALKEENKLLLTENIRLKNDHPSENIKKVK